MKGEPQVGLNKIKRYTLMGQQEGESSHLMPCVLQQRQGLSMEQRSTARVSMQDLDHLCGERCSNLVPGELGLYITVVLQVATIHLQYKRLPGTKVM